MSFLTMWLGRRKISEMCTRWGHAALALVLTVTVGSSALADCMSGTATTEVQMACCKAMHHECHSTADGSSCCPKVSQASEQFSAVKASPAPDLRAASAAWSMVPLLFAPPLLAPARSRPETDPPRHAPPNTLTSALRI